MNYTETHDKLLANIESKGPVDENTRELIFTLAKIITEEHKLQGIVDDEGITYKTTGDKGQMRIVTRPEYIELQRLRDKKRAYIKAVGLGHVDAEDNEKQDFR